MKFHHIGIACKNIKEATEAIKRVYRVTAVSGVVFDEKQKASVCLLKTQEGPDIELISGEQVANIVEKGISYYHLCYEVEDIEQAIKQLQLGGGILFSPPKPAKLFNLKKAAFLYFSWGLIELLEQGD